MADSNANLEWVFGMANCSGDPECISEVIDAVERWQDIAHGWKDRYEEIVDEIEGCGGYVDSDCRP